ncbi:uncharacterized protein BCR38DRAFT_490296 [Pseudomassariella vexata]|uniref:Uncharacterized protein n=1 Tax=Pseudomassariella vexata TaxID=1141098 RepID=A0A1Y2DC60_9PEZI|nr:uncharacterized protein BCR38DRAFT_490296 [Pseudomassariella vexata]ORY56848.1 hypothetical protein BCR38DRAFT_490296 [Pseudomassariella vexata]
MDPAAAVKLLVLLGAAILFYLWLKYRNRSDTRAVPAFGPQDVYDQRQQASSKLISHNRPLLEVLYPELNNAAAKNIEVEQVFPPTVTAPSI